MKSKVVEASNYPVPEDTLVPVILGSVQQIEVPFTYKKGKRMGQSGVFTKWEWAFTVKEGEYAGLTLQGNSEPRFTSNDQPGGMLSLAKPWAEALLGREMELGEEIDTDDLIGLAAVATVRHLDPRPKKDGQGFWFNIEIDELFPAGMGERSRAATSVAKDPWTDAGGQEPPF